MPRVAARRRVRTRTLAVPECLRRVDAGRPVGRDETRGQCHDGQRCHRGGDNRGGQALDLVEQGLRHAAEPERGRRRRPAGCSAGPAPGPAGPATTETPSVNARTRRVGDRAPRASAAGDPRWPAGRAARQQTASPATLAGRDACACKVGEARTGEVAIGVACKPCLRRRRTRREDQLGRAEDPRFARITWLAHAHPRQLTLSLIRT